MITNEMKAKIFGLYLGCNYKYYNMVKTVDGLVVSDIEDGDHPGNPKLILTPLSEITDEDAIEVAKIYKSNVRGYGTGGFITNKEFCRAGIELVGRIADNKTQTCNLQNLIAAIDFIRSKGYMLPYMGIDLFESSIAIPNNKNQ